MVPPLAVLPGLLAIALIWRSPDRWMAACLIVGLILSYGAALTSLGLALATWVERPGRVVALTVSAHLLVTVGWFFLVFTTSNPNRMARGLAEASPFYGVGVLTAKIEMGLRRPNPDWERSLTWAVSWIALYATAAIALLLATVRTFDRRLGRISNRPGEPPPASKPGPAAGPIPDLE